MRIQEAEYSLTDQAMQQLPGAARDNPDARLRVTFGMYPEIDQAASAAEGRPIYTEKEYVTIMVPGDRDVIHRRAWAKDFQRFPIQYAAFRNNQNQDVMSGTPLKMVPWLTLGQVKELEYFNCYTLEQLANLSDTHAHKFMQVQKLRQLAKDQLQAAKEAAPLTALRAELDKRDEQIAGLQAQVDQMTKVLNKIKVDDEDE